MLNSLEPVVVTGAASGLGAAVVDAVARAGATPVGLDVHPCEGGIDHVAAPALIGRLRHIERLPGAHAHDGKFES